jgi:hypothetical protein
LATFGRGPVVGMLEAGVAAGGFRWRSSGGRTRTPDRGWLSAAYVRGGGGVRQLDGVRRKQVAAEGVSYRGHIPLEHELQVVRIEAGQFAGAERHGASEERAQSGGASSHSSSPGVIDVATLVPPATDVNRTSGQNNTGLFWWTLRKKPRRSYPSSLPLRTSTSPWAPRRRVIAQIENLD